MKIDDQLLKSALKLGISARAGAIYITLLKEKDAIAPVAIIRKTQMHRQYVFNALHELQKKDLVASSGHGRGVKYYANPPEKALSSFDEKRLDAIDGVNDLMSLYKKTPQGMIEIIEGKQAVIANEFNLMHDQKIGNWLDIVGGAGSDFMKLMGSRFEEYIQLSNRMRCNIRYIGAKSDTSYQENERVGRAKNKKDYQIKYLEGINNIVNITIRPDSVSFNIYHPEIMVVRIKSPESIAGQKALFEILWNVAKE